MLAETDQNSDLISFHENFVLFHFISQKSNLISVLISCQVRIRSSHLELISSHSDSVNHLVDALKAVADYKHKFKQKYKKINQININKILNSESALHKQMLR